MRNSTVTLLLDQLRRESQKQKEDGDLKDGEYQEISELISHDELKLFGRPEAAVDPRRRAWWFGRVRRRLSPRECQCRYRRLSVKEGLRSGKIILESKALFRQGFD
jgi:hypothetical protein